MGNLKKVLVIDDHPAMGMSLKLMLSPEHDVEVAATPELALKLLGTGGYDLVLCDVAMPGMTGVELHARVRQSDAALAERFVLMTGGATNQSMARAIETSRLKVLEKPFDPEVLRAMLRD